MPVKTKKKRTAKKTVAKRKPLAKKPVAKKARAAPKKAIAKKKARTEKRVVAKKRAQAPKAVAKKKVAKSPAVKRAPAVESLELRTTFGASPERVLSAWLDSAEHTAFTGSDATVEARVGGKHTAWNGYIEGEILELQPGRRIVMSWRTTEFPPGQPDSIVVIEAEPEGGGTELRLLHTELPPGGAEKYGKGWTEFYFAPMTSYFRSISN